VIARFATEISNAGAMQMKLSNDASCRSRRVVNISQLASFKQLICRSDSYFFPFFLCCGGETLNIESNVVFGLKVLTDFDGGAGGVGVASSPSTRELLLLVRLSGLSECPGETGLRFGEMCGER
jgi:hypothetical protein